MSNPSEKRPAFLVRQATEEKSVQERPWKLLVVDDEPEVHNVTRLALNEFRFDDRPLEFISAYSGAEARQIIANDPEIAVILLDVVMETDDAGLQVVQHVRRILGNSFVRIILRTGHPGMAPERRVIKAYDINDYRAKTELTQDRMYSLLFTSLRAYKHMTAMAISRRHTAALADEYRSVLDRVSGLLSSPAEDITAMVMQLQQNQGVSRELQQLQHSCEQLNHIVAALDRLGGLSEPNEEAQEFSSEQALERALKTLSRPIKDSQALVRSSELPLLIGYPKLFEQLLELLLRNSIEHRGTESPSIEIYAQAKGKDWQFTVEDNGKGVPIDQQDKIFEAFSSFEEPGKTGIGLALCRRIVALHGGRIWVEPRPGGGSIFHFTLPAGGVAYVSD